MASLLCLAAIFILALASACDADRNDVYKIGVGIADVTGPAAEVNMMGYAKMGQNTGGIHFRQYSRAFIVDDGKSRLVFLSIDAGMTSQVVYLEAVKALRKKYGGIYTEKNICISSTHTHSGPGGFLQYALYIITSQGFVRQSFDAMVQGIVKSVDMAHNNMQPGYIYMNQGNLYNTSINRSPTSYLNNPEEERAQYETNVDTKMVLLKFTDLRNNPIGMINWFAVHCTSMNNTNELISGDNKGYASLLFERKMNNGALPGQGKFVAAFAQANEGDVSPNTKGPRCIDTGLPCDADTSTCDGQNEKCIAFGPGNDMFESTKIIGANQYEKAVELFDSAETPLSGPVGFVHQYVDMSKVQVKLNDTTNVTTCKPAMGYSFAAGTTDGPGSFDFKQGTKSSSLFWNLVRDLIAIPSQQIKLCQHPKPILLATGEISFPYLWQPFKVPTQILKIGQLAIVAVPAEFTTMSGRRTRNAVKNVLDELSSDKNHEVVIAGLSNTYSSYVATFEEYQVQRYEGASTVYGPHTLQAYIQQYQSLAAALATGEDMPSVDPPPDMLTEQISLLPGVVYDIAYYGKNFGDPITDVGSTYTPGSTVSATFVSGHPRNNALLEQTFLTVEKLDPSGNWTVIATDANWETKFYWKRTNVILGHSESTVTWEIPADVEPGDYRLKHFGFHKTVFQKIIPYKGTSSTFSVQKE